MTPQQAAAARAEIAGLPDGITSDEGQVESYFDFDNYQRRNGHGKELWAQAAAARIAALEAALKPFADCAAVVSVYFQDGKEFDISSHFGVEKVSIYASDIVNAAKVLEAK